MNNVLNNVLIFLMAVATVILAALTIRFAAGARKDIRANGYRKPMAVFYYSIVAVHFLMTGAVIYCLAEMISISASL